jgi:hypothetical protein
VAAARQRRTGRGGFVGCSSVRSFWSRAIRGRGVGRGRSARGPRFATDGLPAARGRRSCYSNVGPSCAGPGPDLSESCAFFAPGERLCRSRGPSGFAKRGKLSWSCGLCGSKSAENERGAVR